MFNISYSFEGEVQYKSYDDIVNKIKTFKNWRYLDEDESGSYGIYGIIVGDTSKPTIFINGAVHGDEYHVIEPIIDTLKLIEDGEHPDQDLNNIILDNFCVIAIPMCNPYGMMQPNQYDYLGIHGDRYTYTGGDINRGFSNMLLKEQRVMRDFFLEFNPFVVADFHMFSPTWGGVSSGKYLAIGTTIEEGDIYVNEWLTEISEVVPSEHYGISGGLGSIRGYFSSLRNPYTPKTLGFMFEHARPGVVDGELVENLSSSQLWNIISLNVSFVLQSSILYYGEYFNDDDIPHYNSDLITEIKTEHKNIKVFRNNLGYAEEIIEEYQDFTIKTEIIRDTFNRVVKVIRTKF